MKKGKVAFGLLTESIAIVCICLIMGLGIAKASQPTISKAVISTQITNKIEQKKIVENVRFDANEIFMITLASLGLVLISSISGVLYATRYEPSKILSQRN